MNGFLKRRPADSFFRQCMDELLALRYEMNAMQWDIDTQGATHMQLGAKQERTHDILGRLWEQGSLPPALLRPLIETDPAVAALRNKLDDWRSYAAFGTPQDAAFVAAIRADVVALMDLRTRAAIQYGFASYVEAIVVSEGLELEAYRGALEGYVSENLPYVHELIARYAIRWDTWFEDLNRVGGAEAITAEPMHILSILAERCDATDALAHMTVHLNQPFAFTAICGPEDIRIALPVLRTVHDLQTLCHEFGHALLYYALAQTQTDAYAQLTPLSDESAAVVMENRARDHLPLNEKTAQAMHDLARLEYTRAALSALFELALWEEGCENAEALYMHWFGLLGIPISAPERWCLDSFRSIDSLYIGNYAFGQMQADRRDKNA